jgi:hypothetical protein
MRVPIEKERILVYRFWKARFGSSSKHVSVLKEFEIFASTLMSMIDKGLLDSTSLHNYSQSKAWDRLLSSDICKTLPKAVMDQFPAGSSSLHLVVENDKQATPEACFSKDDLAQILQGLHLVFESLLLNPNTQQEPRFLKLLVSIATMCQFKSYLNYYHVLGEDVGQTVSEAGLNSSNVPFCLFSWINNCLEANCTGEIPPQTHFVEKFAPEFHFVTQIYAELFKAGPGAMVELIAESGWTLERIHSLPCGISIPILENIYSCKRNPPSGLSKGAYKILDRDDILELLARSSEVNYYILVRFVT